MYKPFFETSDSLSNLFESTYHLKLNEERDLNQKEIEQLKSYVYGKKDKEIEDLYRKISIFLVQNKHVDFTKKDISFILNTPGQLKRAGQPIYRGMILPAIGKYLKWEKGKHISITPKREYVSYSLDKRIAISFSNGGEFNDEIGDNPTAEENLKTMRSKYKNLIHVVLQSKCPRYYLSIYDFMNSMDQLNKHDEGNYFRKWSGLFHDTANWDQEILVFKSIPMTIIDIHQT